MACDLPQYMRTRRANPTNVSPPASFRASDRHRFERRQKSISYLAMDMTMSLSVAANCFSRSFEGRIAVNGFMNASYDDSVQVV
jgi:hypothetical protein